MRITRVGFTSLWLLAISGCMPFIPGGKVYPRQMRSELQYRGFSVARPNDPTWYAIPSEESNISMHFWRDSETPTHTYVVTANLLHHNGTIKTPEEFASFVEGTITGYSARCKLLSQKMTQIMRQGQPAVEYFVEWEDHGAAVPGVNVLYAYMKGVAVLHPTLKDSYVDAFYSERGTQDEISARTLAASGDYFLEHLTLYDAPGKKTDQP